MSALPSDEGQQPGTTRLARWATLEPSSTPPSSPSPGSWLFGGPSQQASELAELRQRLAETERRAEDAEAALPHLLALGQRTVNGLLSDARARWRQIIDEARVAALVEIDREREALAREGRELDALRMAVAAEAMGLEQIRRELEAATAAKGLAAGAPKAASVPALADPRAALLPPPPSPAELDSVGMGTASPSNPASPSRRFAEAWAEGEDEMMAEAFDRFFQAEIERDPHRDAAVEPGPIED